MTRCSLRIVMVSLAFALVAEGAVSQAGPSGGAIDTGKFEVGDVSNLMKEGLIDLPHIDQKLDLIYESYTDDWTALSPEIDPPSYGTFILGMFQESGRRLSAENWRLDFTTTEDQVASEWIAKQWLEKYWTEEEDYSVQDFLRDNPELFWSPLWEQGSPERGWPKWEWPKWLSGGKDEAVQVTAAAPGRDAVEGMSSTAMPAKTPKEMIRDAIEQICDAGYMPKEITVTVGWSGGGTILGSIVYEGKEVCSEAPAPN